ncbi:MULTISPECIES: DEAD/DEAH box helicase [Streptomyces]|uniref:ATP-dependent helicase n=1 Tax=Streptomyces tsukubensis (strain DSM 42081 / NBRC 108919 / NRRL 18488 / 9993) TaxID=1114943 RepID=I2N1F2_STRT9|nr:MULTISPECIES: DEAD/DEAH box helicase [Streptomyces]AZK95030.1 RNA helicase [Streptomyces tsukubensis]EIF90849.1 ATP-dependent RNA helicase [Streptomyces tsukubensis NRRL18488]MYS63146.1 DEAD/DEAH box helicase [Streptomyces sp. SID5473]QKM68903.1 ATP-dependent helicase [Streptomyces tsukubensis NRRL18488]TAI43709.1 DEAD/DEAH box helicase [Streptomyces tsukubensis]
MSTFSSDQIVVSEDESAAAVEAVEAVETAVATAETTTAVDAAIDTDTDAAIDNDADADLAADADIDDDEAPADSAEPGITFGDLGLPEGIVRKLAQNGVTTPFPIQAATIPDALDGKDILGRGRTGSGKTLSFGLPLLATLSGGRTEKKKPRGVILTPTRELAMQVADALQPYGDVLGLKMKVVCGGTSMGNQIYALERGVDILVATPGRLRDVINRGACSLEQVQVAILDEADQMSDLGFLPEVTELLDQVPQGGQRMLFSATMENEITTLVKRYLNDPVSHEVDSAQGNVTTMTHHVLVVKPKDKAPVTAAIAARKGRTIIFVRTQLGADRVAEQLRESGVKADALHGGMTQGARTRTLADFKDGYVNVLVATDVAARGIHVDGIDLVLNVDPAGDHKDYLHRSGRTARAGKSGTVVSLSLPHQRRQIFRLMEDAGVDASRHIVGGAGAFDPEVAEITGARSLTEVQADSANNAAKQAEREVADLTRQLERVQRRAVELRDEADRLVARAARERGDDPEAAVAEVAGAVEAELEAEAAAAAAAAKKEREERSFDRDRDRRDDRGNFERRDRRDDRPSGGFRRDDRRDDRPSGGFRRDDRRDDRPSGGFRRDDRPSGGFRRDDRRDDRPSGGFRRDDRRDDRPFNRDRRDERPSGGFRRDDRPSFDRDRRDDRPSGGFRRDDRPSGGHRGSDRPFNRDRRDDRPSGGFRSGSSDRPYGRRDDHRGTGSGSGSSSFGRRDDKPRWKRNG